MPTRNVVLTEHPEEMIESLVKSGRYQNASEVLRQGLRLVEQSESDDAGRLEALRTAARAGISALDRGEFKEFGNIEDLQAYLNGLSDKIISRTPNKPAWPRQHGACVSAPPRTRFREHCQMDC
jgi:antitoxin ParD1/3/4